MPKVSNFEELVIWQKSRKLAAEVYRASKQTEFAKDFALRDQIRRSVISILSNIAEGFERDGNKEFIQFLSIAKGSTGELRSQIYIALDQAYISRDQHASLIKLTTEIACKIARLMDYLHRSDVTGTKYKK